MFDKLKLAFHEARTKATTYVALGIAGLSQVAEHAQDIVSAWPSVAQYVPDTPALKTACHWLLTAMGVLVIFTRIRRLLKT